MIAAITITSCNRKIKSSSNDVIQLDSLSESISYIKEQSELKRTYSKVDIDTLIRFLDQATKLKIQQPRISKAHLAKVLDSITISLKQNHSANYLHDSLYV